MRESVFFVMLLVASACVVVGVGHWSHGAAWIAAGLLLAVVTWLILGGDRPALAVEDADVDAVEVGVAS